MSAKQEVTPIFGNQFIVKNINTIKTPKSSKRRRRRREKKRSIYSIWDRTTTTTDGSLNHDLYLKRLFRCFGKYQASWQMGNRFAICSKINQNHKEPKSKTNKTRAYSGTEKHVVGLVDSLECLHTYVSICYVYGICSILPYGNCYGVYSVGWGEE